MEAQALTVAHLYWVAVLMMAGYMGICETLAEQEKEQQDMKVVGQCFKQASPFSFVSLYCGYNQVIEIRQAFHGSHKNFHIQHCSQLPGDCTRDTTHMYNWAKCEGRHSCVQVMKQEDMPKCDTGTMQYLQVEYTCLEDALTTTKTIPTLESQINKVKSVDIKKIKNATPTGTKKTEPEPDVIQEDPDPQTICTNHTEKTMSATVTSPGYPSHYLSDMDCRCIVQAGDGTKVSITYADLGLVMRGKQCVDWLLVQSLGHKVPAAVTCGQLKSDSRTLVTNGNWALLHFHTANSGSEDEGGVKQDSETQMKKVLPGFKINIRSVPEGDFKMQCYTTHPSVLSSLRYKNGKHDATDNLILPASDLETIGKPGSLSSTTSSANTNRWATGYLQTILLCLHILHVIICTLICLK